MKSITDKDVEKSTKIIGYKRLSSRKSPLGYALKKAYCQIWKRDCFFIFFFLFQCAGKWKWIIKYQKLQIFLSSHTMFKGRENRFQLFINTASKNITKHKYQTQFNWHNCLKPLVYWWKCQFLLIYKVLQGTIITCTGICISFTCFTWKRYKENKTELHVNIKKWR